MNLKMENQTRRRLVEAARNRYAFPSDDNIEIDDDAKVTVTESGVWVQAWVYLTFEEATDGNER